MFLRTFNVHMFKCLKVTVNWLTVGLVPCNNGHRGLKTVRRESVIGVICIGDKTEGNDVYSKRMKT